jgi:hypothetical protein
MPLHVAIGIDDFRKLRELDLEYIDKTHLVRELIDRRGVEVFLLPRPRRFGKSLNLSMLRCFFEKRAEDLSHLFDDLSIWRAGEAYRAHFQRYPVIYMTLKGAKHDTFEATWGSLREKITDLFIQHRYVLDHPELDEVERRRFQQILDGTAGRELYDRALLHGDAEAFEEELPIFATNMLSYHDGNVRAEQLYQGFLIGLLAVMEPGHRVRSNRESGKGRPDVMITPTRPGAPGVVLELKVAKPGKKTPEQALAEGLSQIEGKDGAELLAAGASPFHAFAVAFDGKQVWVRAADQAGRQ